MKGTTEVQMPAVHCLLNGTELSCSKLEFQGQWLVCGIPPMFFSTGSLLHRLLVPLVVPYPL